LTDSHAAEWEELARREPYFAVLTSEGLPGVEGNRIATAAFLETGEEDIASLLSAIASLLGHEIAMGSALDFGCGTGRLTLPLARRAASVVACDIAPTMLTHARTNAEAAGLHNVTFLNSGLLAELPRGQFDFVCSLLVLQYIHPVAGYRIIQTLLDLLAPRGIAALHVTFATRRSRLERLSRWSRTRSPVAAEVPSIPRREQPFYARVNGYDERLLQRSVDDADAGILGRFALMTGTTEGAVLVIQKQGAPVTG
jgi:SAM-dependent methyltransferase